MHTTTVVIGGGHAGLAMSRRLTERSIDHVVIERGEVANSWRTERWPTLRLLTPNWQTRLPNFAYEGEDPDGYMSAGDVAEVLAKYAAVVDAPVHANTTVQSVRSVDGGYSVVTDNGTWNAPTVVLASGACNVATVPACADGLPSSITSLTPMGYHGADALPEGGVLVVGASATGAQLADEVQRSGRPVTLSVGEHVRMPRTYRGRDIFWWMEGAGVLDERHDEVDDVVRARHVPSAQLIGTPARVSLDLNALTANGVHLVGRIGRIEDGVAQFAGSLANVCALADLKLNRLLNRFDEWATDAGIDDTVEPADRPAPTRIDTEPPLSLDLNSGEIRTVIWATGYRPDYSWLDVPVVDRKGHIRHDGGVVTDAPGMYVVGLPFLRRRRSTFINGSVSDTEELSAHLRAFLG
ncbi:MAG: putative flavoprotein involved in transport [Actinomycetota bacterium]|jgi:putative flavoprotein involved in K+ transport